MPLSLIILAALAFMAGYAVVVASSFLLTFAVTTTAPRFVAHSGRINNSYLIVQAGLWSLCSAAGGYVAGTLADSWHPAFIAGLLAVALIAVNWINAGDTGRQDATPYRILISTVTACSVLAGYALRISH